MIHQIETSIDYKELYDLSIEIKKDYLDKFHVADNHHYFGVSAPQTTKHYHKYNILTYPNNQLHSLYHNIKNLFHSIKDEDENEQYYIQAWVNIYATGDFIDWHKHWEKRCKSYHGYFCVNVGNSITAYQFDDQEYRVKNKNGDIVISKSGSDVHRTFPWTGLNKRITIAFDIVPQSEITWEKLNHWLPI